MTVLSNGAHERWQLPGFMEMQTPPAPTAVSTCLFRDPLLSRMTPNLHVLALICIISEWKLEEGTIGGLETLVWLL